MRSNAILARVVSLIILALCTFLFFHYVDFYQDTDEKLLVNGVLSTNSAKVAQVLNRSTVNFPESLQGVSLENDNPKQTMSITYTLPAPSGKYVRVRASLSVDNVQLGDKPWKVARAFIVSGHNDKWSWQLPHLIAKLSGTIPLKDYSLVVGVPKEASKLRFSVQLVQTTGRVLINCVSLTIVEKDRAIERCVQGLMFIWILVSVWFFYPLLASWRGRLVLLLGSGVLTLILTPKTYKHELIMWLSDSLKQTALPEQWLTENMLSSAGHFSAFLCLSLITLELFRHWFFGVIALLLSLALLSELLQNFAIERHAKIEDFMVDVLGILVAAVLVKLFTWVSSR